MFGVIPAAQFADASDAGSRTGCALLLHCDGSAGSVSTLTDSSGNGRNAACTSVALITPGLVGSASASFSGSSYADVSDAAGLEFGSSDFLIELTIKPSSLPASGNLAGILTKRTTGSSGVSWVLLLSGPNALRFELSTSGGGATNAMQATIVLPTTRKSHIAIFRRGPLLAMAVDGVVRATANVGTSAIYNSTSPISLGRLSTGNTANMYSGLIDELCIEVGSSRRRWNFVPPNGAYTV